MCRRCVVCGKYVASNSTVPYHYPKNKKEALIWQRSMAANESCVDNILKQCCVCIEHIPQFVELAQKQAALMTGKCDVEEEKQPESRPSLNVLLLTGASLLPNCASGKTESQEDDVLDEDEIVVSEFNLSDRGAIFPDYDETEVTVMRTPVQQNEDEQQQLPAGQEQCGDCTDVLLLSRSRVDETPCQCTKLSQSQSSVAATAEMSLCCPQQHCDMEQQLQQPPCCDCERKVRLELGEIIERQQHRICELEYELCRQSDWQFAMYKKLQELYAEFGCMATAAPAFPDERTTQSQVQRQYLALSRQGSGAEVTPTRSSSHNLETSDEYFAKSSVDNITKL